MLVVGDFNVGVGTHQNVEVDDNVMVIDLMHESKNCIKSDYGRLLIHMLKCTHLNILNSTHVFPMTNVLTCLPASRGGNVVDYVLLKEWDASIVNTFSIGPLSFDSNHNPYTCTLQPQHSHGDHYIREQKETTYIKLPLL